MAALFSGQGAGLGPDDVAVRGASLPASVRRYLEYAVPEGAPAIRRVRLTHGGSFRAKPDGRWYTIAGQEYFTVAKPGFVWSASIRLMPFVWIEACDSLVAGEGRTLVRLNSVWTLTDAAGPEIACSSGLRWLAEAAWFPPAFAGAGVVWEELDRHTARAALVHDGPPITAEAEFDDAGRMLRMCADRFREIGGGRTELTPWGCRYEDYRDFGGLRAPASGEAFWKLESGEFPYARFRVKSLEYGR